MSVTEARCQAVAALPSWAAYAADASPFTLADLLAEVDVGGLRDALPSVLARHFNATGNWRTAQHAANELLLRGQSIEVAFYYADRALQLSGGNAFARLSLVRCFWLQRFPAAVLHHLHILRHDARTVRPAQRREQLLDEIADLYANVLCYCRRLEEATPWIRRVLSFRGGRGDTLVQIFACVFGEHPALELELARRLAPHVQRLSQRDQTRVHHVLRRHLLATLRARP
jgi:hypothetical protein